MGSRGAAASRGGSVAGRTTMETDGAGELCSRLAARYWDLGDPVRAAYLATMLSSELVRVVLHPEDVRRFAY